MLISKVKRSKSHEAAGQRLARAISRWIIKNFRLPKSLRRGP